MKRSVALLSGGLDSAVTAAIAAGKGRCTFVHVNYGQRTEDRELKAFKDIVRHYGVESLVADMPHLKKVGGSALTDKRIEVPKGKLKRRGIPVTYVPFRNAQFLSAAVSVAEAIGANEVYIGAVEEDSSGYPDCREAFFKAFEKAVSHGAKKKGIKIRTPLIHKRKAEIVRLGVKLKAPLHLTWSCYKDSARACGQCDSCLLRLRGFEEAGVEDPIPYKAKERR